MNNLKREKTLIALCCIVYFTSYITRHNYAAALAEIVLDMNITKSQGSFAMTGMFITYGLGQLISGFLGDKCKPHKIIFGGLLATALCNMGITFLHSPISMTVLWCINGVAQAMLWPPLVRIMAENLSENYYRKACVYVAIASSIGSISVYLFVPICIILSGWRLSFFIPAIISITVSLVWLFTEPHYTIIYHTKQEATKNPENYQKKATQHSLWSIILLSGSIPIIFAIICQGMLRDGITTWMPTFISEHFALQTSISILTTVFLPLFSIFSISAASWLQKKCNNDITASILLFITAFLAGLILFFFNSTSITISAFCMMLITGCMHGINMLLISRLPIHFHNYGRISTISGLLNTFTYVGSAISSYGFAIFSEQLGWGFTIGLWTIIALIGAVTCIISLPRWNRFIK